MSAMEEFKLEVVRHLAKIEELCKRKGLTMSQVTLIMRDPANDDMCVMLTTEKTSGKVREAVEVVLKRDSI